MIGKITVDADGTIKIEAKPNGQPGIEGQFAPLEVPEKGIESSSGCACGILSTVSLCYYRVGAKHCSNLFARLFAHTDSKLFHSVPFCAYCQST